ncbi:MAG: STAS/SEC14 domain-containing protein [Pyrinomonadaceae bacterium]|nr:STAS/SEC14 domain-containing protein [Pyrinomonadaceae bacterium]
MPTIQTEADQLLDAVLRLPSPEFDKFITKLQVLRRRSEIPRLPERESELLRKINQGVPHQLHRQYETLRRKRRQSKLTRDELQNLLALTEQMEQFDVERLKLIAELAELRGLPLPELMHQLGLEPSAPEYV